MNHWMGLNETLRKQINRCASTTFKTADKTNHFTKHKSSDSSVVCADPELKVGVEIAARPQHTLTNCAKILFSNTRLLGDEHCFKDFCCHLCSRFLFGASCLTYLSSILRCHFLSLFLTFYSWSLFQLTKLAHLRVHIFSQLTSLLKSL